MRLTGRMVIAVVFIAPGLCRQSAAQGLAKGSRGDQAVRTTDADRSEVLKALGLNSMEFRLNNQPFNLFQLVEGYRDFEDGVWRDPGVNAARQQANGLYDLYSTGLKLYTEDGLTAEEKAKALGNAFIAGLLQDEDKAADVFGLAAALAVRQQYGAKILREAKIRHIRAWKRMIPLCQAIAGPADLGSPLEFTVEFRRGETDCHFIARNSTGRDLKNVTFFVNPTFGDLDRDMQNHYVFVPRLSRNDFVEFANILPHPSAYNYARGTKDALVYSLYSDELHVTSRTLSLTGWTRVGARNVVYKSKFAGN